MAEEKILIPVASVAAYVTVITADLLIKLGNHPSKKTVAAFKKATIEDIQAGALLTAPEDYRNLREILSAVEAAEQLKKEQAGSIKGSRKVSQKK
jgi:hypothetical protein